MKQANNRFAELLLQNNINPSKMFFDKKRSCYVSVQDKVWWRYYKNNDILSLSRYGKEFIGGSYEDRIEERLYQVSVNQTSGEIISVSKIA